MHTTITSVQVNHNETAATDRPRRLRPSVARLAAATLISSTTLVLAAEAAHARIAVNHNEAAGRDA